MNAAWGGISEEKEISICISEDHKTTKNILARKAFTVSMSTAQYMQACDYVGIVSGNKEPDKHRKPWTLAGAFFLPNHLESLPFRIN